MNSELEIPTVKAELERKTVDLLMALTSRAEEGRMHKSDLAMVGRALWNITSGLVDEDVSKLCGATADSAPPRKLSRFFIGNGNVLKVIWAPDLNDYVVVSYCATTKDQKVRPVKSEIGIREVELENLFALFLSKNYKEI